MKQDLLLAFETAMATILELIRTLQAAAATAQPAPVHVTNDSPKGAMGSPSTTLIATEVQKLNLRDGALFDHVKNFMSNPHDLFRAREDGLAGLPPIANMEDENGPSKGIYKKSWRAAGDRHNFFCKWQVVYRDIASRSNDKGDREKYSDVMHLTYGGKRGPAVSTLAKLTQKMKAQDNNPW